MPPWSATQQPWRRTQGHGYQLLKGKNLKEFKDLVDVSLINEGNKAPLLGVFSFRAVLNLAMLLTESERAKAVARACSTS